MSDSLPIVSVIGWHNVGKTSVVTALVQELKMRGIRVAVIKHTRHDAVMDVEGSDTWRIARVGADMVMLVGERYVSQVVRTAQEPSLEALAESLGESVDLLITEGYKQADTPKIEVCLAGDERGRIKAGGRLVAVVCDDPAAEDSVPVVHPDQAGSLAYLLVAQFLS